MWGGGGVGWGGGGVVGVWSSCSLICDQPFLMWLHAVVQVSVLYYCMGEVGRGGV